MGVVSPEETCAQWQNFEQNKEVKALSIMPADRARL